VRRVPSAYAGCGAAQGTMHLNMNSGLFYIKASAKTVAFMDRIAARLSREKAWDQARARPRPHGQA